MMIRRLLNSLTTRFQFTMPGYMMSNNWINICPSARSLYKRFTRGVTPRLFIQLRYAANCKQNAFLNYYITYVIQGKKIICCCINFINYPVMQQRRLETLRQQNKTEPKLKLVTFCVSRRRRKMYSGHASLCVWLSVCVSLRGCMPTLLHGPGCNLGNGRGCSLVVQYWADLQSMHGFRFYDNIAPHVLAIRAHDSIAANAKCQRVHACTRSMLG